MFGNNMNTIQKGTEHLDFSNLSTKERILQASFELSAKASVKNVSLSDIAKKAGIAKPGIFRYYKSKDDLQETMKERFFDDFCAFIHTLPEQTDTDISIFQERETKLLEWFMKKNDYLLFFLNTLVGSEAFIPVFVKEMCKRNIGKKTKPFSIHDLNKETLAKKLYLRTTEMFFLLARMFRLGGKLSIESNENLFSTGLVNFFVNGWESLEDISKERMEELDGVCCVDSKNFPQETKMFQALSSLLENYALSEITVEKMASELGMAKSSLYTYYKNKDDMIKGLIEEELILMIQTMHTSLQHGKTFSEYIYLHMRSQMEYLSHRNTLLPVCNRLSVQGFLPEKFLKDFFDNIDKEHKKAMEAQYPFPSIGFPVDGFIIGGWIFSLSVSAFKLGQVFNFSPKHIDNIIRSYYSLMKNGIKGLTE